MTQEEKQLLVKDLCARLPYGVKVCARFNTGNRYTANITAISADRDYIQIRENDLHPYTGSSVEDIRPYLRPMSSMTIEERKNMGIAIQKDRIEPWGEIKNSGEDNLLLCTCKQSCNLQDWLNEHHFDYRRLIKKGLALEAPKDMYKND